MCSNENGRKTVARWCEILHCCDRLDGRREGRPGAKLSVDCNTQEAVHGSKVRSQVVRSGGAVVDCSRYDFVWWLVVCVCVLSLLYCVTGWWRRRANEVKVRKKSVNEMLKMGRGEVIKAMRGGNKE